MHCCRPDNPVILKFKDDDPRNPYTWSSKRKAYCAWTVGLAMGNSTLSSSLPGGTLPFIAAYFDITAPTQYSLPSTVFLVGYVLGPLLFSPMSEQYGRKPIMLFSFGLFFTFSLSCALAPSFVALVVFRFFAGVGGSASISVIGGVYADIFEDKQTRGRATAMYTVLTTIGTTMGPTLFGYVSLLGWRWSFGIATILAGITFGLLLFLPETFAPVILQREARRQRCSQSCQAMFAPAELDARPLSQKLITTVSRPFRMFFTEAIVFFSCIYVSLVFAVLFLFFQAYAFIFRDLYQMSISNATLAFIPMGLGTVFSTAIFLLYDSYLAKAELRGASWTKIEEFRRLPLACAGAPLLVISLFWLAWTSRAQIHWIVPMIAGFPFAVALLLILAAFFNYLTDSYVMFSASALAAASCVRSIWGALLPMAASPMYQKLGIGWATSVLGFAVVLMMPIPFVFIIYGNEIRARSKFCQKVAELKELKEQTSSPIMSEVKL
ncbi:MFS general substrate transporter [Thozetella sp. PMI_491]|nr:MFS general substrate transporter [Thozetella sp. PMI_491]